MLSLLRAFWASFVRRRHFDVIGGQTGCRYRVYDMNSINVDELDSAGRCVRKLCFQPDGLLVPGDVLLAQKLALELYELDALSICQCISLAPFAILIRPTITRRRLICRS